CPTPNPGTWTCSMRKVTINGQIQPVITMRPGEVQRWRLIDTGFRQSFTLRLEDHALHEIALDGLYTGRVDTWPAGQTIELQPGYRSDVLVNVQAFDPNHSRKVVLNNVDQWSLSTAGDPIANQGIPPLPHVFHIHVNPFQMDRRGPSGQPQTVWKDTVLVPPGQQINV